MLEETVRYIGFRGPQPVHGHGGANVVGVARGDDKQTLVLDDDRFLSDAFEWGYEGIGPSLLAQAILNDFLGFKSDVLVGQAFMRDVVAVLPPEFEITGAAIIEWLGMQLAAAAAQNLRSRS